MLDQFQMELQQLLRKYNKEIKVSIQPIIVDAPKELEVNNVPQEPSPELIKKILKGKKK